MPDPIESKSEKPKQEINRPAGSDSSGDGIQRVFAADWKQQQADNELGRGQQQQGGSIEKAKLPDTTIGATEGQVQSKPESRGAVKDSRREATAAAAGDGSGSWSTRSLASAINYLESIKPAAERTLRGSSAGDRAQRNVYELLSKEVLPELKKQGLIGAEWQLYPSIPQSPADKVGADFLLVNTKTGETHFIDPTTREEKGNVFNLRKDGVIVVDNMLFDKLGALKVDEGGEIGQKAGAFKAGVEKQIIELSKTGSAFKLGQDGVPLPSLELKSADRTTAEINTLVDWAREQARSGSGNPKDFENMAQVVERAAVHTTIAQAEVFSPKFAETARNVTQNEIAKFAFAKYKGEKYAPASADNNSEVRLLKDGRLKLATTDGERLDGGALSAHLSDGWKALLDQKRLLSSLSNKELQSMGADTSSFPKKGTERADAIEKALRSQPKFRVEADKLRQKLQELRPVIESGGAVGRDAPVLAEAVVSKLKGRSEKSLLQLAETPAETTPAGKDKPAKPAAAAETLKDSAATAASELAGYHKGEQFTDGKASTSIAETMELMILEQQEHSSWPKGELEKFSKLHEAYTDPKSPEHAESVKKVHEFLNEQSRKGKENEPATVAQRNVEEIESKLRGNPSFERLTDPARMSEALKQLSDRALQRMPESNNEKSEFLSSQLKATMRKQLGVSTDAELPESLRNLQVKVVDSEASALSLKPGTKGSPLIEIPARLLKENPRGAVVDAYTQASGLSILSLLNKKGNSEVGMRSLKPMLDKITGQAEKIVGARSIALAQQKPAGLSAESSASDRKAVIPEAAKQLVTSWDGENLTFGGEKFHIKTELADLEKSRSERIKGLEREFAEAKKLAEQSNTESQIAKAHALETQLAAERQNFNVVSELGQAMSGGRGQAAQAKASALVKAAADRAIEEHFSRGKGGGGSLSRAAAIAMVLSSIATLYFSQSNAAQADEYRGTFR